MKKAYWLLFMLVVQCFVSAFAHAAERYASFEVNGSRNQHRNHARNDLFAG